MTTKFGKRKTAENSEQRDRDMEREKDRDRVRNRDKNRGRNRDKDREGARWTDSRGKEGGAEENGRDEIGAEYNMVGRNGEKRADA